jgi:hypothetical protein
MTTGDVTGTTMTAMKIAEERTEKMTGAVLDTLLLVRNIHRTTGIGMKEITGTEIATGIGNAKESVMIERKELFRRKEKLA